MSYSDKYTTRSSSFANKFSPRSTRFADAFSRKTGYLQKEDEFYLLLETGAKIVLSGAAFDDKYSLRDT